MEHGGANAQKLSKRHGGAVSCWVNLPTFKSNGALVGALAAAAALIKLPSRVTTYLELMMGSTTGAAAHVAGLAASHNFRDDLSRALGNQLIACEAADPACRLTFEFGHGDRVLQFAGRPPSAWELAAALK